MKLRENIKIVVEGIKNIWGKILKLWRREFKNGELAFFDYFNRFLSNRYGFDSFFVLNGISCLILLLAIISRVFNQLILVKLFVL